MKKCRRCSKKLSNRTKFTKCTICRRPNHKTCVICNIKQPSSKFHVNMRKCKKCFSKHSDEKAKAKFNSHEEWLDHRYQIALKFRFSKYNMSVEEAKNILKNQNNKCLICEKSIKIDRMAKRNEKACLDHCHTNNEFRGFLCHPCNAAIGLLRDNVSLLHKIHSYLS